MKAPFTVIRLISGVSKTFFHSFRIYEALDFRHDPRYFCELNIVVWEVERERDYCYWNDSFVIITSSSIAIVTAGGIKPDINSAWLSSYPSLPFRNV